MWVDAYHSADRFARSGAIQQALGFDVRSAALRSASVAVEGYGGQLPNLDLAIMVQRTVDGYSGLRSKVMATKV